MQIRIEDIEYHSEFHAVQPESNEERTMWATLDFIDRVYTALAITLINGSMTGDYGEIPTAPPHLRKRVADTALAYVADITAVVVENEQEGE